MNKDKMRVMADRVFRDMAGGMAAGLAYVGTETGPVSRHAGARCHEP